MKPTVIYLIGTPYCGSTILGAILGQHKQIENVGELGFWTHKKRDPSVSPCACGKTLAECVFWSKVHEAWLTTASMPNEAHYRALQQKYEAGNPLLFLQRKSLMRRTDFQEYARLTRLLMEAVAEVSGKSIVFDSTKSPWRAVALATSGLEIIPIHLVRSGPNFISSSIRRRLRRRQSENPNEPGFIFKSSLRWLFTNLAAEIVSSSIRKDSTRIRYEQVVENPREAISKIGESISLDLRNVAEKAATGEAVTFDHSMYGSYIRMLGPTALKTSTEEPLSSRIDGIFQLTAGWLAKRYGY